MSAWSNCRVPKRQRTGALQNASRHSPAAGIRASVLDCGGPPPLFPASNGTFKSAAAHRIEISGPVNFAFERKKTQLLSAENY